MVKTIATGLRDRLAGVQASQEVHDLKEEITTLQAELSELRTGKLDSGEQERLQQEVQRLTSELADRGGKHKIALGLIDVDPEQPRQTITESMVAARANSLRRHGQLTPIIVIPQPTGRYKLFEGELRTRASTLLEWTELEAVFLAQEDVPSPDEVFRGQVVTSIHSQRLHDLDIAQALIRLAVHDYPNMQGQESIIPNFLNTPIRRMQRENTLDQLAEVRIAVPEVQRDWLDEVAFKAMEERQIFELILGLQLNPVTVNTNIFPLLKLAPDLKEAIQIQGLESSKARELHRLNPNNLKITEAEATELRQNLTAQVIEQRLSLTEIKAKVNQLIEQHNPNKRNAKSDAAKQLMQTIKEFDLASESEDNLKALLALLNTKAKEVKSLLNTADF